MRLYSPCLLYFKQITYSRHRTHLRSSITVTARALPIYFFFIILLKQKSHINEQEKELSR